MLTDRDVHAESFDSDQDRAWHQDYYQHQGFQRVFLALLYPQFPQLEQFRDAHNSPVQLRDCRLLWSGIRSSKSGIVLVSNLYIWCVQHFLLSCHLGIQFSANMIVYWLALSELLIEIESPLFWFAWVNNNQSNPLGNERENEQKRSHYDAKLNDFSKTCVQCKEGWKPPRAHHCKRCKRCVFKVLTFLCVDIMFGQRVLDFEMRPDINRKGNI